MVGARGQPELFCSSTVWQLCLTSNNSPRTKHHVVHPNRVTLHPQKTGNISLPKIITLKAPSAFQTVCLNTAVYWYTQVFAACAPLHQQWCMRWKRVVVSRCGGANLLSSSISMSGLADGSKCNDLKSQT